MANGLERVVVQDVDMTERVMGPISRSAPNAPIVGGESPVATLPGNEVIEQITGNYGNEDYDYDPYGSNLGSNKFDISKYNRPIGGNFITDSGLLYQNVKKSNWFADILAVLESAAKKVVDVIVPEKKEEVAK